MVIIRDFQKVEIKGIVKALTNCNKTKIVTTGREKIENIKVLYYVDVRNKDGYGFLHKKEKAKMITRIKGRKRNIGNEWESIWNKSSERDNKSFHIKRRKFDGTHIKN